MLRRINNWSLLIMVILVSIISVALIQNHVLAQWLDPTIQPGDNNSKIYFNPAVDNLDLNANAIADSDAPTFIMDPGGATGLRIGGSDYAAYFDGDVNIDGNLTVWGSIIEGGAEIFPELFDSPGPNNTMADYVGQAGKIIQVNQAEDGLVFTSIILPNGLWTELGNDIYRDSNVGIGSTTPSKLLVLESNGGTDAAIAIQSGSNDPWVIYNEETSNDLRFWNTNSGDAVSLTTNGELLINTNTAQGDLTVSGTAYLTSADPITLRSINTASNKIGVYGEGYEGIKGYTTLANGTGVYGVAVSALDSNGVYGLGKIGVYGNSNSSAADSYGVYGVSGSGLYGGFFSSDETNGAGARGETTVGEAGVWGVGTVSANYGVRGDGKYGVAGYPNVAGGAGIYGQGSATADAAYFEGDLVIEAYGGTDSFLKLDNISDAPLAGDCDSAHKGRMIFDTTNHKLWVCSDQWRSTILN